MNDGALDAVEVLHGELLDRSPAVVPAPALSASAAERIANQLSPNTRANYASQWGRYTAWCADRQLEPMPCHVVTLTNYANHLMDLGRSPSTIWLAVAAIGRYHEEAGLPRPSTAGVTAAMADHERTRADADIETKKARVLHPKEIRQAAVACDTTTPAGVRDRLFVLLSFAIGRRYTEVASLTFADFKEDDKGLLYRVRRTKTDRAGKKSRWQRIKPHTRPELCVPATFRAWRALLEERGITGGIVIRQVDRWGKIAGQGTEAARASTTGRLSTRAAEDLWHRILLRADIDPAGVTTHTGRRSAVTAAHRAGRDAVAIADRFGYERGSASMLGYIADAESEDDDPMEGVL